jgi:hypothetical protein
LALQTFASTSGDIEKTAKLLGIVAEDVRRDLLSFVNEAPATLALAPAAPNGTDETAINGRPKTDLPQERVLASAKKPLARKR